MIFLVEYNRKEGRIITFREFSDSRRHEAEAARLELELTLNHQGVEREVVLLEAANEEALHNTHERYFAVPGQLLNRENTPEE